MVRTLHFGPQDRPQAARIIGIAATLALHVVALLLLLIPMTAPRSKAPPAEKPEPRWQIRQELPITPPPQPIQSPMVRRPSPQAQPPRPLVPSLPPATAESAPFAETMPAVADPLPGVAEPGPLAPVSGPVDLSTLAYLSAPPPPYPAQEARSGIEGTVILRILVGTDGVPEQVSIERSSGNRNLDRAALRQVKERWRFQPAVRDGQPVPAYGRVPVEFSLR